MLVLLLIVLGRLLVGVHLLTSILLLLLFHFPRDQTRLLERQAISRHLGFTNDLSKADETFSQLQCQLMINEFSAVSNVTLTSFILPSNSG